MECSRFPRLWISSRHLLGLLFLWHHVTLVQPEITTTQRDLGQIITHVTVKDSGGDIYVGGVNFIAQLSNTLDLHFNLSIGPVNNPEHCLPYPAPCDNHVKVLEIDTAHGMLLVCGSAYRGTCTLHSLLAITEWYCLYGDASRDGADMVSSSYDRDSVVHFLSSTTDEVRSPSVSQSAPQPYACRAKDFGQEVKTVNNSGWKYGEMQSQPHGITNLNSDHKSQHKRATDEYTSMFPDNKATSNKLSTDPSNKMFYSNLVIAGSFFNSKSSINPLHLSFRRITYAESYYMISYSRDQHSTPVGFQMKNGNDLSITPDYKLSFSWEGYSYFIFLQQSADCSSSNNNRRGSCMVTKISRTCNDTTTILPYVEIPIACGDRGKSYHLLTSAVLGSVGLVHTSRYMTVPVLLMAFGNNSDPASPKADPKQGSAFCAITLDDLNKLEFGLVLSACDEGQNSDFVKHASWITGTNQQCHKENTQNRTCSSSTKNKYIQGQGLVSITALQNIGGVNIVNILTHTYIIDVDNKGESSLLETMDVFLLTNTGSIRKLSIRVHVPKAGILVKLESAMMDFFNLSEPVSTKSVAVTDHSRAVMYLTSGSKIMEFDLEFCLQFQTCSSCLVHKGQCSWCLSGSKCRDKALTPSQCKSSEVERCMPRLHNFRPVNVPKEGGTVLTINGTHLGRNEGGGQVNVTVCNQPCDYILANEIKITCTVRERCATCPATCDIAVSVSYRDSEGNASTSQLPELPKLTYMVPKVTTFSPTSSPAFGGTVISIQGENMNIGSSVAITVGGSDCGILPNRSELSCRISVDDKRKPQLADLVISIDNYRATLNKKFEFRPNPAVKSISPLSTIASGGVTLTVTGENLNSALELTLTGPFTPEGSNITSTTVLSSKCIHIANREKMACKTPDISQYFRSTGSISITLAIDMDGIDVVKNQPALKKMTVHADPMFFEATIFENSKRLVLQGDNIPTWIGRSDITVTITNTTLKILSVKNNYISCDLSSWDMNELQMGNDSSDFSHRKGYNKMSTKEIDSPIASNNSGSLNQAFELKGNPLTNTESRDTESQSGKNEKTKEEKDEEALIIFETPVWRSIKSVHEPFLLVADGSMSKSNISSGYNTTTMASLLSTSTGSINRSNENDSNFSTVSTSPDMYTTGSWREKIASCQIMIKIGNYRQELNTVEIKSTDNLTSEDKNPEEHVGKSKLDLTLVAGAGGAGLVFLLLVVVSCVMYSRAKKAQALVKVQEFYLSSLSGSQHGSKEGALPSLKQILESVVDPDQRADMDKLIVSLDCLTVGKTIGSGNFGCVYEGFLTMDREAPGLKVAVKTLQDPSSHTIDLHAFVKEAVLMREFQHPHVLGLIGLAEKEPGIPYVILPYMEKGDLLTFVRNSSVTLSLHDVIKFGADIASGMAYLTTLKFVHRDLAARNCMLDELYRVKVADFGLCRDIYEKGYYTSDNRKKLPIRWMAMESIEHGAYSSKSDVWSFGVVLWELLSRGLTPYPGIIGWDIINFLRHRRLAPPYFCPDAMYDLMMQCWAKDPNLRPDFTAVQTTLLQMVGQSPTITDTMKRRRGDTLHACATDSSTETSTTTRKDKRKPEKVPRKTLQATAGQKDKHASQLQERSNTTAEAIDNEKVERPYINVDNSRNTVVVKNVFITIPTCYSHRDVSKTAAGIYIQLVDNYEPPPKFSNPFLRSVKKHTKKFHGPSSSFSKRGHDTTADTSAYSVPIEYLPGSNTDITNDSFDGRALQCGENILKRSSKNDNYYELENTLMRTSAGVESHSGWSMLSRSGLGSHPSILDAVNEDSSINISYSSTVSSLSAPYNNRPCSTPSQTVINKPSPTVDSKIQEHTKQDFIRNKNTDVFTYL